MQKHNITVGDHICISDIQTLSKKNIELTIDINPKAHKRIKTSKEHIESISSDSVVYGINTGFGPMAQTYISPEQQQQLQYNLIRSHACGMGDAIDIPYVRAAMLIRLHTLAQGYSGVSVEVLDLLRILIEKNITPIVPEHGSVGASGDLVQLAHIALALIGEGEVIHNEIRCKTKEVFKKENITPAILHGRDGLALINGTSVMTAIAALNSVTAHRLISNTIYNTALLYEIIQAHTECIDDIVSTLRPHSGQKHVIKQLQLLLKDSQRVTTRTRYDTPDIETNTTQLNISPQEIYSLRCVPQILGPIYDTLCYADTIIETEINSVTDNPIINTPHGTFHNGNFHGDYVALEMDKCRIAVTKLSLLLERQINFIVNPKQNGLLPPFVNGGEIGLDLGLQAAQFVATSTAAENQTLATPMSTHTITTNNDNQDIVSMGTNSALLTAKVIENTYHIQSVLYAATAQAVDILQIENNITPILQKGYTGTRKVFPFLKHDEVFYTQLENLKQYIKTI